MTAFKNEESRDENPEQSLHCVVREGKGVNGDIPMLILLHGVGSNENDLFTLAQSIPQNWMVVSVRGPFKMREYSYRWYEAKLVNGKIAIDINELLQSKKKLESFISEILKKYKLNGRRIVIAGFSQGANMAQTVALGNPNEIHGFGVFSGRWIEEFAPYINKTNGAHKSSAFISHGSKDAMLPKSYMEENERNLRNMGIHCTISEDTTGHYISPKQWSDFMLWLMGGEG